MKVKIGTAPDSWGIWFPNDPKQVPWQRFLDEVAEAGYLSALNCNGNLLDPHPERGERSRDTFYKTVQAASLLGLDTVVTMSGCPGDPSGTPYPNWVTHPLNQSSASYTVGSGTRLPARSGKRPDDTLPTTV